MKKLLAIHPLTLALVISLSVSCGSAGDEQSNSKQVKISYVDDLGEGASARLMIEGMTCERMCVNAVTKSVSGLNSVKVAEMHFDTEQAVDTLVVDFDPSLVDEAALIDAIEKLAGGDTYQVREVQLNKDIKTSQGLRVNAERARSKVDAGEHRFEVPNFLDLLRKVSL